MALEVLILCLAMYGLCLLVWQLWQRQRCSWRMRQVYAAPTVFVVVENAKQWIEWFLRKVSLELYTTGRTVSDIIIIDTQSCPETSQIVSKLQRSFPYVTYVPSSTERRWQDTVTLLEAAQRTHALFIEVRDERGVAEAIQAINQISN